MTSEKKRIFKNKLSQQAGGLQSTMITVMLSQFPTWQKLVYLLFTIHCTRQFCCCWLLLILLSSVAAVNTQLPLRHISSRLAQPRLVTVSSSRHTCCICFTTTTTTTNCTLGYWFIEQNKQYFKQNLFQTNFLIHFFP